MEVGSPAFERIHPTRSKMSLGKLGTIVGEVACKPQVNLCFLYSNVRAFSFHSMSADFWLAVIAF